MSVYRFKKAMQISGKSPEKISAEIGISKSTLYRFMEGHSVYGGTLKLIELWAERQLRK